MKPVIGITVDCAPDPDNARTGGELSLYWNYAAVIAEAGGNPILLTPMTDPEAVAKLIHGWLIPGGKDIDPAIWEEEVHPKTNLICRQRFDYERRLLDALPSRLPILGICYGCQFLNVAFGGSLDQHLPDLGKTEGHIDGEDQEYEVSGGSRLATIVGHRTSGKSYHHQAVKNLGAGLRPTGRHADGTIEAIEAADRWLLGVQWHPERSPEANEPLFRAFVQAASDYAQGASR